MYASKIRRYETGINRVSFRLASRCITTELSWERFSNAIYVIKHRMLHELLLQWHMAPNLVLVTGLGSSVRTWSADDLLARKSRCPIFRSMKTRDVSCVLSSFKAVTYFISVKILYVRCSVSPLREMFVSEISPPQNEFLVLVTGSSAVVKTDRVVRK